MSNIARKLMGVKPPSLPVEIIGAKSTTAAQGTSLSSVAHEPGDYIIFMNGNNGGSSTVPPPALTAGYTDITDTGTTFRAVRVQYKIATTFGIETVTSDDYGVLIVVKNAVSIGQFNSSPSNTFGSVVPIPALSDLNTTNSLILAGSYWPGSTTTNDISSVTSPFTLGPAVANSGDTLYSYVRILSNASSSLTSKTMTISNTIYLSSWAVEILGG